jgi:hypothetical protein
MMFGLVLLIPTIVNASLIRPEAFLRTPEKQAFTLKFIDTSAGECEIETLAPTVVRGRPALHYRATVRTIGLFWLIYPYTQTVNVYVDPKSAAPFFVDIQVRDRKKNQHTQIRLDGVSLRGEEIEDSVEPDEPPHHRKKMWAITPGAQSIFSILPVLRAMALKAGAKIAFPVSHDEKNGTFDAEVTGVERIPVRGQGLQEAYVVRVGKGFTDRFYGGVREEPVLWFSTDGKNRLLRFEFKHRRGKIFALLDS